MRRRKPVWVAVLLLPIIVGAIASDSFATCTGSDPCSACKNCRYCKHCAKESSSQCSPTATALSSPAHRHPAFRGRATAVPIHPEPPKPIRLRVR
jgi:hypothetical protein